MANMKTQNWKLRFGQPSPRQRWEASHNFYYNRFLYMAAYFGKYQICNIYFDIDTKIFSVGTFGYPDKIFTTSISLDEIKLYVENNKDDIFKTTCYYK